MTLPQKKSETHAPFFLCVEYLNEYLPKTSERNWESYIINSFKPDGSDVFKIFDWGIWFVDDQDCQHWMPWRLILDISFEENVVYSLPETPR